MFYDISRRLILKGVDGIVFVADSQRERIDSNIESLWNLENSLKTQDNDLKTIPYAIQLNKRDLPNILSIKELTQELNCNNIAMFEAVAYKGIGVYDTFKEISKQILSSMSTSTPNNLEKYKALEKYSHSDLAKIAKTDSNEEKRLVAIFYLAKVKDQITINTLFDLLKDKTFSIRLRSLNALEKINSFQAIAPIIELLKDEEETIRSVAISILAKFKDEKALNSLITIFTNQAEPFYLRSQLIETLTILGDERIISPLITALEDPSPQIRTKTAEALGRLKATKAVNTIIERLKDTDPYVRAESAEALGRIGDKKAVDPLIELLKEDGEPFEKAKTALTELIGEVHTLRILHKVNPIKWKTFQKEEKSWWQKLVDR